jgi:hypothetical protein
MELDSTDRLGLVGGRVDGWRHWPAGMLASLGLAGSVRWATSNPEPLTGTADSWIAPTWKPCPLGPSPLGLGLEFEPAGRGADPRQRAVLKLQPVPLMQPTCQARKRVPAHYLETFLLEITYLAAFPP